MDNIELAIKNSLELIIKNGFNTIYVAYSGGVDSSVLLHCLYSYIHKNNINLCLKALHINHGINKNSDYWSLHCQNYCKKLNIDLMCHNLNLNNKDIKHLGLEGAARKKRYECLYLSARQQPIFLAHHAYDQIETFILQLQRASGIDGLCSMPTYYKSKDGTICRPFINLNFSVNKQNIKNYAACYSVPYIEDESNADTNFKRNYIRHNILDYFKDYQEQILQSINILQEQKKVLDEYVKQAISSVQIKNNTSNIILCLTKFKHMLNTNNNLASLVFRQFFKLNQQNIPSYKYLHELLQQINKLHQTSIPYNNLFINLYDDMLYISSSAITAANYKYTQSEFIIQHNADNTSCVIYKGNILYKISYTGAVDSKKIGVCFYSQQLKIKLPQRPHKSVKNLFQEQKISINQRHWPFVTYKSKIIYYPIFSSSLNTILSMNNECIVIEAELTPNLFIHNLQIL